MAPAASRTRPDGARGAHRDPLEPEEAESVDQDGHGELARDEEADRGEGADPRAPRR